MQNLSKQNEAPDSGPAIVDVHEDKNMYKIAFDLPDAGLVNNLVPTDHNDVPKAVLNVAMPNVVVPLSNVPALDNK